MKIILLKDVPKVGKRYETKDIADGYAQNLLIPKGLAIAATPDAVKRIELERSRDEGERRVHDALLKENLAKLDGAIVTMTERANEKGHLFAGIHKLEIIPKLKEQAKVEILPEHLVLDKPIKQTGETVITVKVGNVSVKFTLIVKSSK